MAWEMMDALDRNNGDVGRLVWVSRHDSCVRSAMTAGRPYTLGIPPTDGSSFHGAVMRADVSTATTAPQPSQR